MNLDTLFRQNWWVTVAVVLAALQVVFAIGIGADSEASSTERFVIPLVWLVGAVLVIVGARRRGPRRRVGDALIAVGVVPSVVTALIAFWFPPMWLVGAAGAAVIWSSGRDGRAAAAATS